MERLETALEKARQNRRAIRAAESITQEEETATIEAPSSDPWLSLPELKFSARAAKNARITTLTSGPSATPYDMLRSRALRIMGENNWKRLAITSPNSECGKTTACANLAFSLARQSDLKVLVLDMDFRRPSLHRLLGNKERNSFHEVLEGTVKPEDQLVRFGPNLAFGLNMRPSSTAAEILQSHMAKQVLDSIEQTYEPDYILFDMPPMLLTDDNVGFLRNADCALLIGAADSTTLKQLDICEKELGELTSVLGVVLNKCRYSDDENDYSYNYY